MSDPKSEKVQSKTEEKVEEKVDEKPAAPEENTFGGFGAASSWLNQGSSWGASFLNSAKEKTMTTLDLVKKDLNDLSEAVTAEVTDLASAAKEGFGTAANAVKQQAQMLEKLVTPNEEEKPLPGEGEVVEATAPERKEEKPKLESSSSLSFGWMSKIVDTVADTVKNLAIEETTNGEDEFTEVIKPKKDRKTCLSKLRISEIQSNEETYLKEPGNSEFYERWQSRFNLDEYDGEVNILLANTPLLRQIFARLVPAEVNHETFWKRYFYAIEVAEMEEEMNKSTLSEVLNVETKSPKKSKRKGSSGVSSKKSSPSSESSAVVVEEPTSPSQSEWSVCSEKNVMEIPSEDENEKGPLTPRPDSSEKKEEGWVNWDE
uniref:BSD domain-containing protein n=1 Tax=Caenorhabditis tropicalis TaxID=1561998 RepID=A0A1I7T2N7_9PELO